MGLVELQAQASHDLQVMFVQVISVQVTVISVQVTVVVVLSWGGKWRFAWRFAWISGSLLGLSHTLAFPCCRLCQCAWSSVPSWFDGGVCLGVCPACSRHRW